MLYDIRHTSLNNKQNVNSLLDYIGIIQERRHEFSTGGTDSDWGGTDSGESKPPTPKF